MKEHVTTWSVFGQQWTSTAQRMKLVSESTLWFWSFHGLRWQYGVIFIGNKPHVVINRNGKTLLFMACSFFLLVWAVQGKTECLHIYRTCLHFNTRLVSLGWKLASKESVTESGRPWKLPAAGAMRRRWIMTDVHSCSFLKGSAHDLFPSSCDFSGGGTTFKDHKSCKCHQSLTKAICPESSFCGHSPQRFKDRALIATVAIPHCASTFFQV